MGGQLLGRRVASAKRVSRTLSPDLTVLAFFVVAGSSNSSPVVDYPVI